MKQGKEMVMMMKVAVRYMICGTITEDAYSENVTENSEHVSQFWYKLRTTEHLGRKAILSLSASSHNSV